MLSFHQEMKATRLLIAPVIGKDATGVGGKGRILSLQHPKSGSRTSYMLIDGSLQEFQWFKQSYGSWFIGDYVCKDGSLYIATPIDTVFILLPVFEVARMKKGNDAGMFRQLEEILFVDGYPGYQHLMPTAENCMHLVCEIKEIGSTKFYRLENSKVLAWLCHKVHHLEAVLAKLDKNYAVREGDQLRDAVFLLGEYLEEPLFQLLCGHLKLNFDEVSSKEPKTEFHLISSGSNNPNTFHPTQMKDQNGKNTSSSGKKSKKLKSETDSQNIKDMFHRASRRESK
ncbi:ribonuclease H2 subunit B [Dioscorea cayenensis subsp. rotundata]|uniref:Ribonuclease H2 subunit B n=1 Tax=Dioscorea cayennensis subsp. rotundata TaxID=55577 RepID=A0AB40B8B8_DIOCR|nr:ribonuclease H2 subunit B [Dioscorea cayenensis subsp. rotundata]